MRLPNMLLESSLFQGLRNVYPQTFFFVQFKTTAG